MRCVLVSEANLKADTRCAYCRTKIGESYARAIGSRFVYCNYDCYEQAAAVPIVTLRNQAAPAHWTVRS